MVRLVAIICTVAVFLVVALSTFVRIRSEKSTPTAAGGNYATPSLRRASRLTLSKLSQMPVPEESSAHAIQQQRQEMSTSKPLVCSSTEELEKLSLEAKI